MDRYRKFLKILFIGAITNFVASCIGDNKEDENILDLPDYNPKFEEVVGKYYFIPIKDENYNRDDYKYLNLKKGDTLFLEIKEDSTYSFNKFYYDRENNNSFYSKARQKKNLSGKLIVRKNSISLSPNLNVKNATIYLLGFKKSEKTGLYYYYAINSPTDASFFEYYLLYKKMR
jgi:hypothetical protein